MADMGVTETNATALDLVVSLVQEELKAKAVLAPSVMDYSAYVVEAAKTAKIPRATSFTAANKAENTQATASTITFSTDDIDLNIHKIVPCRLEDIARQSTVDLDAEIIGRIVSALADALEVSIAGVLVKAANDIQLGGADVDSNANQAVTLNNIIVARKTLDDNNVPGSDRFMAVAPKQEAELLRIANFIQAERYGSNEPIMNGEIGRVLGFKVLKTTNLADNDVVWYHKTHVGYAMSRDMKIEQMRAPLGWAADDFQGSMIYGVKQLDSGNRGVFADESATS